MRVWLACFFVLFALAEFFDWVKELSLPLPIYILGGAFLAVASNYNKLIAPYINDANSTTLEVSSEKPHLESSAQGNSSIPFAVSSELEASQKPETK